MFFYSCCVEKKQIEYLLDLAEDNDGYLKVEDAAKIGIGRAQFSYLLESGLFLRVARGLYIRKGIPVDPYYLIHYTYRKAVFDARSSLYLHGLIEKEPSIGVNLPSNYMTRGIEDTSCRHLGEKEYGTGQSLLVSPKGNLVLGYDIERCILEVLRNPADYEKEEIHSIWRKAKEKGIDLHRLEEYGEVFHCLSSVELALAIL